MKNNLNFDNWDYFLIMDIFPKRRVKKYAKKPEIPGKIEFVSSSSMMNGVSTFVDEDTIPGNCITVSTNGGCFDAFYHDSPIAVSSDVEVLYNKNLNKFNAIFICTILRMEKPKWAYGRKPKNNQVFETCIKLPSVNGSPDWKFMEEYIKNRWIFSLDTKIKKSDLPLDLKNWKEFKVGKIISRIFKAKANHKIYLNPTSKNDIDSIQYITRTEYVNGFDSYIKLEKDMTVQKANSISIGDTTATAFFQDQVFVCGDHIVILQDEKINKYTGLFIRTLLNFEKYRYSYGRAFTIDKIKQTQILLPCKDDGNPDWEYMENYIKSLPYSDKI